MTNVNSEAGGDLPVTEVLTFKKVGEVKLKMKVYYPPGVDKGGKKIPGYGQNTVGEHDG